MTMIKILGPKNKITPLINTCKLLDYQYTLDQDTQTQGVFIYSNENIPYFPLNYCFWVTENPNLKKQY